MHLIALRMRGFKSFAETTELRFWPGVAVVVGPNGSGKSNIADALQWAMASQPPSQLRAQTGTDVLFAGSDTRAPCGICEVELVLANDGRISLPHDEVSVMRRVRRDGEGEYLLNRAQVRRLDVQEALADAGLGRELHCVVSQGSVDAILLSRPEERRGLVEEAAGLGKYKRRRQRAQLKLARVRADLERAADIEREIRARLRPLELQATAAERAAGLARDIAERRLRLLGSEGAALRKRRGSLADDRDRARERVLELESILEAARTRREAAEAELASLAGEQERASSRAWALEAALERLSGRAERLRERLADAAREAQGERERATRMSAQAARSREAAAAAGASAATLAGEAERLRADEPAAELAALTARAGDALEAALSARRQAAEAEGGVARAGSERARCEERLAALREAAPARAAALEAAAGDLQGAEAEAAEATPHATAAADALTAAVAEAELAQTAADAARADERAALAHAAQAGEQASAAEARVAALDEALRRADGVAPAVRRLAERGALLSVSLVSAPAGVERAVAAALACRAAAVAGDIDSAIALLHGEGMDGASVLVAREAEQGRAAAAPRGARALADVATADAAAPPGLLDGIWLVDEPASFAGVQHGLAVTPDGLCYDAAAGVVSRPGAAGEAALLSGRRELAGARDEAGRAGLLAAEARAEVETARTALEAADGAATRAREALASAHERLARADQRLRDASAAVQSAGHALDRARALESAAGAEEAELQGQLDALAREESRHAEAAAEATRAATAADTSYREHEQERRALAERDAHRRAELAALEERIGSVRADAERESAAAAHAEAAEHAARRRADTLAALAADRGLGPGHARSLPGGWRARGSAGPGGACGIRGARGRALGRAAGLWRGGSAPGLGAARGRRARHDLRGRARADRGTTRRRAPARARAVARARPRRRGCRRAVAAR